MPEFQHVGDLLAQMLMDAGVRHIFGVPGGQTRPLYDGIHDRRPRIDHVLMRDERSGVFAADGYARASGSLGVCDGTVGPGATNLVSGLAEALNSATPLLAIVADIPRGWEHLRPFGNASQGFRQAETLRPVSKALVRLDAPEAAAATIALAVRTAVSGRPGPVVLEIPDDVFSAPVPEQTVPELAIACPPYRPVAAPEEIERVAERLRSSRRPVLLVGSGALTSGAWEAVAAVAERLGAPVLTSITGKGIIEDHHPLAGGVVGTFGRTEANEILAAADTVLAIGCKLGQLTTMSWRYPRVDQTLLQLDIDPAAVVGRTEAVLIGDARATLTVLGEVLEGPGDGGWGRAAVERGRAGWEAYNARIGPEPGVVDPRGVLDAVNMVAGPEDALVCDASLASGWGAAYFSVRRAGRCFFAPRGMAGLGWGGPAAIGVQAALGPNRRVFALIGDGAWGYSLAEMESAVRRELPVVAVILNNGMLAWVHHGLRRNGKIMSAEFAATDYAAAAEACGALGVRVGSDDELEQALARALRAGRPALVDVRSSQDLSPIPPLPEDAVLAGGQRSAYE